MHLVLLHLLPFILSSVATSILFGERDGQLALLSTGYRPETDVLALLERWLAAGEGRQSVA